MKAAWCKAFAPVADLTVEEVAAPVAGAGEVLIDVHAAGVNFPDGLMVQGKYQTKPPLPFAPGSELAGVVAAVGEGVTGLAVGDRVAAFSGVGSFAEQVVAPAPQVFRLPDAVDFTDAAGLLITYGTSWHALKDRAALRAGETLLVLGAAGGVGLAAVELGALIGARVIAAASTDAKLALARERGAAETIRYSDEDLRERIKALTGGRGVDVVYDPVGGATSIAAIKAMAWGGRHLVVGFAGGDIPQIPANLLLLKSASSVGVLWGNSLRADPVHHAGNIAELLDHLAAGRIRPVIDRVLPLDRTVEALEHVMERRAQGKVILSVRD
ncbi:NADPH:quinone oxidoreductase family protein [Sphingomonas jatrophae]|uniref:NADPH2:quinone reductase n=1 Tax=Sphingomonas jatrophae TaxID=1166337 RepID=A0A1I6KHV8_9SPHN|nr:NADPH:quinone oxidoreductase family protein [Sphingomonas jatrophae]SFR90819.1 NADPH2:quinone reductase [Sphingomonas jatrophae]